MLTATVTVRELLSICIKGIISSKSTTLLTQRSDYGCTDHTQPVAKSSDSFAVYYIMILSGLSMAMGDALSR